MILVFGRTGQVANELSTFENIHNLGRDIVDLQNLDECSNAIFRYNPEAVINAAAYTAVDRAESDQCLARKVNSEAPAAMAKACAALQIPLVHISTDYVFDGGGMAPWSPSDETNPINFYGKSKLLGEQAIVEAGCVYAILRTSWVISAHGNNFLKTMLRLSKSMEHLRVVDDQIGGPTCARDIAETCILIAEQLKTQPTKSGVYHYTGQPDVSWCELANEIFERCGSHIVADPIPTSQFPTPALRPLNSRLNCSKTKDAFGISRPYWRDGLQFIFKELEQNYE